MSGRQFTCRAIGATAVLLALVAAPAQAQINWTDWIGAGGGTATGTLTLGSTTVGVTYSGPAAFFQTGAGGVDYWRNSTGVWEAYDAVNAPTGTDMIGLSAPGTHTLTFSQSISGLFMALVSVGQPGYGVSYGFNNTVSIIDEGRGHWGDGTLAVSADGTTLTGNEGHGVVKFGNDVTTLQFTTNPNEYWHGFNIGAEALSPTVVPEPGSILLLGTGLLALGGMAYRRRRNTLIG